MSLPFYPQPKPGSRVADRATNVRDREQRLLAAKREVWARDDRQCRICHKRVVRNGVDSLRRGEVHHIRPRSLAKELYTATSNLVLLCVRHHKDAQAYRIHLSGDPNTASFKVERSK